MANTLDDLMPKILARGLMTLRKRLSLPALVNRSYEDEAARRGQTIDVPLPPAVQTRDVAPGVTPVAAPGIIEETVKIDLVNWKEVPIAFTDRDRLETIDDSVMMATDAAANALAEDVNGSIFATYTDVYSSVGTAGTTPFAADYAQATAARKALNNQKAPLQDRRMVIDPDAEENAINLSTFADSSFAASGSVIIEGDIGRKLGFDWVMDQQVPTHTVGSLSSAPVVNGAHAAGVSTISITAAGTGTIALKAGDVINIAGDTQAYAVTADVNIANAASGSVSIRPDLQIATAGGEAVSLAITADHVVNLGFNRDAFALAVRPLGQPRAPGTRVMTMVDSESGLPLRLEVSRQNKQDYWSFDILWGVKCVRPELAVRVMG